MSGVINHNERFKGEIEMKQIKYAIIKERDTNKEIAFAKEISIPNAKRILEELNLMVIILLNQLV